MKRENYSPDRQGDVEGHQSTSADDGEITAAKLLESVTLISSHMETSKVAWEAARQIVTILGVDICAISQWDPKAETIQLWAEYSRSGDPLPSDWVKPTDLSRYPLVQKVLSSRELAHVQIDDPEIASTSKKFLQRIGAKVFCMLPLESKDSVIGIVEVFNTQDAAGIHEGRLAELRLLIAHAGVVLERTRLLRDAEHKAATMEALRRASLSLTASLDLEEVLSAILENTLSLLDDALDAHIFLYDGESLTFGAALWADGRKDEVWAHPRPEGLTYSVARSGESIMISDMGSDPLYAGSPEEWKGAIIGLPLKIGSRVVGVMNVAYQNTRQFSEDDLRGINLLADQAALAVENARLHNLVTQQALTDPLTGLANRRAFDQRLDQEIRRSLRYDHPFSLVMVDFDDFKLVNDSFGHPAGDETLIKVGLSMQESLRDTDFVARIGGDEFSVILPETGFEAAAVICEKMKKNVVECEFSWSASGVLQLHPSTGIASFPEHAKQAADLIAAADDALYRIKRESPS